MQKLSQEYLLLFNKMTDAEQTLLQLHAELVAAQQQAEELYMNGDDSEDDRTNRAAS